MSVLNPRVRYRLGDGVGRMFRPLGDELLLVDEAHRAQVLGGERRRQILTLGNGLSQQVPEISQPRVFSGLVERPFEQRGDPRDVTAAGTRAASSFDVFRNSLRCAGSSDSTSVRALSAGSMRRQAW